MSEHKLMTKRVTVSGFIDLFHFFVGASYNIIIYINSNPQREMNLYLHPDFRASQERLVHRKKQNIGRVVKTVQPDLFFLN